MKNEAVIAAEELKYLPLGSIRESKTNHRTYFDPVQLKELAASIEANGVLEPILVRPLTLKFKESDPQPALAYEVVFGHRRLRAAVLAKLGTIPARIKSMNEQQVLEVQLIENLQRQDVHPMEEAQGFALLLKCQGYTADLIGEKIGKDRSYVYKRLQFNALTDSLKNAFTSNRINIGHALLLCRLQPDDQARVEKEHLYREYWESEFEDDRKAKKVKTTLDVKELNRWIHQELLLSLAAVPWDKGDALLVPAAGSCITCPKRSGANLDLFDDLKKGDDRCLDRACFTGKLQAFIARRMEEAEAAGVKLVQIAMGYVTPVPKGVLDYQSYRKWDGKQCEHLEEAIVVAGEQLGQTVKICRDSKCKVHSYYHQRPTSTADVWRQKEKDLKHRIRLATRRRLLEEVILKAPKQLGPREAHVIARSLIGRLAFEDRKALADFWSIEVPKGQIHQVSKQLTAHTNALQAEKLPGAIFAAALIGDVATNEYAAKHEETELDSIAKALRVDVKGIERNIAGPLRAAFKKRRDAATKKKKGKPSGPTPSSHAKKALAARERLEGSK
jgi:ParB family chromosome partitioning protein